LVVFWGVLIFFFYFFFFLNQGFVRLGQQFVDYLEFRM